MPRRLAAPEVESEGDNSDQTPGKTGRDQVQPDGASGKLVGVAIQVTLPATDQEPLEVLSHNKVIKEAGCLELSQDIPGHRDGQHQYGAANPGEALPEGTPAPGNGDPQKYRQTGQNQNQRALGKQADSETEEEQPAPDLCAALKTDDQAGQYQGRTEGKEGIGHHRARCQEPECGSGINQSRPETGPSGRFTGVVGMQASAQGED